MKKLTTRKNVLGMLMAFVLALGVQGVVDAQTVTRGSGDLQLKKVGDTFSISFRVSGVTFTNGAPNESITLPTVSGVTLTKIGSTPFSGTTLDANSTPTLANASYTLTYTADALGQKDITIGGVTYTIYVVTDATTSTIIALTSPADDEFDFITAEKQIDTHFGGFNTNDGQLIRYVVSGGGSVFVREAANRKGGTSTDLLTSSDATVYLQSNSKTNKVTVSVERQNPDYAKSVTYIYSYARVTKVSGDKQNGIFSTRLENPLIVEVRDGSRAVIPGVPVTFTSTVSDASFLADPNFPEDLYNITNASSVVKTDTRGIANMFLVLGSSGDQDATATVFTVADRTGSAVMFTATGKDASTPVNILIVSGDGQRVENGLVKNPLVVKVVNRLGQRVMHVDTTNPVQVEFLARDRGTLDTGTGTPAISKTVNTNSSGEAEITYIPPDGSGQRTVSATLVQDRTKSVTFTINGPAGSGGGDGGDDTADREEVARTLTFSPVSISGAPGTTQSLIVSAGTAATRLVDASALRSAGGTISQGTGNNWSVTLPDSAGSTYTLTFGASGYDDRTISVSVTAPLAPGTLTITAIGSRVGNQQGIRVTAQRGGSPPSSALTVSLSGVTLPPTVTIPANQSSFSFNVTLPTATSAHTLTADATGYNPDSVTIPAPGQQPAGSSPPTTGGSTPPGTATRVQIRSNAFPSGTVNTRLAQPLVVRVVDANGNGVANIRVTFNVTSGAGTGRLSQRGNGSAIRVQTNASGEARTPYTPQSASSTVRASAAGVSQTVTFTITTGAAPATPIIPTTPETPSMISPVVHIAAASRASMLWVDGGAIYALVGEEPQKFVPGVTNAMNIAVAGDKVYWTEKTGESGGSIKSANLDGTGVTEITKILATPTGIAVDIQARRLYVTNTGGRILSINLDTAWIQTVLQNLQDPVDIAVAGGNAYWTQANGQVRFVNLTGTQNVRNISTGADVSAGSLVIAAEKVYWTEQTGERGGTIKSANLDGTGAAQVASILAGPTGIAVDTARSKIYVTNTGGRILRMNLNGSFIQTVVDGLGRPGDMVLSNSIMAPPAETPTTPPTTTPSKSKYDINADGSVNSTDVDLLLLAVLAELTDAKYDVNGDGTVDVSDVRAVNGNLDAGAASAPTLFGMKMTIVQVDRLQEQIDLLIATGDRSPAALKTLIYLQQLLATARPEKTQLLANYPNPFNPETWIPYELATDTDVRITIYNAQGVVIRTLHLGQQSAGYYTDRERAAYWDGRNALGEQVASGIYFYQFETDTMLSMRKMVILK